jgi:hypothetical protein
MVGRVLPNSAINAKASKLHTGFGGGIGGDDWNVQRIQLIATLSQLGAGVTSSADVQALYTRAVRLMEAGRLDQAATAGHEAVQIARRAATASGAEVDPIASLGRGQRRLVVMLDRLAHVPVHSSCVLIAAPRGGLDPKQFARCHANDFGLSRFAALAVIPTGLKFFAPRSPRSRCPAPKDARRC